jgi:DNA-binding CsgD family transcriptional regulator/tetratricopeptide (TPR) repeat protein
MLGRDADLAVVAGLTAGLVAGRPAALDVLGEPGIGKTRFLDEVAQRSDVLGALVLQGSASELEQDLPFAVFVDALDEHVRGLPPDVLDSLELGVRAELSAVLPSLSAPAVAGGAALQHERYRSHRAVRELLQVLAARRPVLLLLDDLHWADRASAELLTALLRRPPSGGVMLCLTRRPRQTERHLSAALERAQRAGLTARITLRPLARADARELVGPRIPADLMASLYDESGGNPFYLEQLARFATSSSAPSPPVRGVLLAGVEMPESVATAMLEELDVLSPRARTVLDGAAVAGDPFETDVAAVASGVDESDAYGSLDELLALDVIRSTTVPRRYRFRHPIVRRAVYESAGTAWRVAAHERVAHALAERGAPVTTQAAHMERCARRGDQRAVDLLRTAGEQAFLRAPTSAARWYGAAETALGPGAGPGEHIALLLPRATALAATGDYAESHAVLLECLALAPADPATRTRLIAACAALEHLLGQHEQARRRLLDALADLPEGDSSESAAFMVELAMDSYFAVRYDDMEKWARRALGTATRVGDQVMQAIAGASVTLAGALAATTGRAPCDCSRTSALIDEMPDEVLAPRLDALGFLAFAEQLLERFPEARAHADRVLRIACATGQGQLLPLAVPVKASMLALRGELVEAGRLMDAAVEAARLTNYDRAIAWVLVTRSPLRLAGGDLRGALDDAQEAVDLLRALDERFVMGWAAVQLASVLLECGEAARAESVLVELGGGVELRGVHGGWRAAALEVLTRCQISAGRVEQARRSADHAVAYAETTGLRLALGVAGRAVALVRLHDPDPAAAVTGARLATTEAEALGCTVETAVSRTVLGRALARAGQHDEALVELRAAAAALDACGAVRHRDAAQRELRRLGQPIHRRSATGTDDVGLGALTERELEVAGLVADGSTNPEIAATLYLSQKTVETHLRHIFHKLEVASRLRVAQAVDRSRRSV